MTSRHLHQNAFATILIAIAMSLFTISASASDEHSNKGSSKVHPVDETKKAAKAVGHGFRDGARAVGHGAKKITREVGHAFRDGARKMTGKKD